MREFSSVSFIVGKILSWRNPKSDANLLHLGKPRHRAMKWLARGHSVVSVKAALNSPFPDPEPFFSPIKHIPSFYILLQWLAWWVTEGPYFKDECWDSDWNQSTWPRSLSHMVTSMTSARWGSGPELTEHTIHQAQQAWPHLHSNPSWVVPGLLEGNIKAKQWIQISSGLSYTAPC